MRKILFALALLLCAGSASAQTATATVTPTATPTPAPTFVASVNLMASQNTYIQGTQIANLNAERCAQWGLDSPCTTAEVKAAGCVPQFFQSATLANPTFQSCTIYTQDAAGQALYFGDLIAAGALGRINADISANVKATCTAWKAANNSAKNSACSAIGQPNGCLFFLPGGC